MAGADGAISFADFPAWLAALCTMTAAIVVAIAVDRVFARRLEAVAVRVLPGGITQQTDTRLRFVRRLAWLTIVLIGFFVALSYFTGLTRLAASVLASGALAAAIVGFAARQVLANLVAGTMLALTQPLRVGDWVTFEDSHGVVEDVRLNYTILRTASEARIVIPNERLAGGVLRNDTLAVDAVAVDVPVWLPPGADIGRALQVLGEEAGQTVTVAESAVDGVRLAVSGERVRPAERAGREAELRAACLRRLHAEGLLTTSRDPPIIRG